MGYARPMAAAPDEPGTPGTIDKAVSRRFWEGRTAAAADPRAVTLDRQSAASIAREVRLYQRWLWRRIGGPDARLGRVLDLG